MHARNDSADQRSPILDTQGPDPVRGAHRCSVELAVDGDHAVEWLAGDIDLDTANHVVDLGALAIADPRVDALVLDLTQVTFFDSTGLGALVHLRNHAELATKRFALRGVPQPVSKVMALTHLDKYFGLATGDQGRC